MYRVHCTACVLTKREGINAIADEEKYSTDEGKHSIGEGKTQCWWRENAVLTKENTVLVKEKHSADEGKTEY